jgi:hypothetical protein
MQRVLRRRKFGRTPGRHASFPSTRPARRCSLDPCVAAQPPRTALPKVARGDIPTRLRAVGMAVWIGGLVQVDRSNPACFGGVALAAVRIGDEQVRGLAGRASRDRKNACAVRPKGRPARDVDAWGGESILAPRIAADHLDPHAITCSKLSVGATCADSKTECETSKAVCGQ